MPTYFQRPENALKRANEFIDVGKKQRALDALYDVIKSKRHRSWQKIHEPIMEKYLELCVELKKSHIAKEGLYQYKNICQQVNSKSLEDIVRKYLYLAEEKTEAARVESHQNVVDVDDLDILQTPESLIMSAVSGEDSQDRNDRAILTPWLKFLWESYRQCLDLLRNNSILEKLYQDVAQNAFKFCLKYSRKTEFRKLCDNLRTHLGQLHKHQNQLRSINLNNPESQSMHLETRLAQLDSAIQMELWQEAYKAVEDIHNLIALSKKQPRPSLMANYYQKLGLVLYKSGNSMFHACAWHKLFHLYREQRKGMPESDMQKLASHVLCATLAIPLPACRNQSDHILEIDDNGADKQKKLAGLLSFSPTPTRLSLVKDLVKYGIVQHVYPELNNLFQWLEVDFQPLLISARVITCLEFIAKKEELAQYIPALKDITIMRLVKQISQVYQTIEFPHLCKLAPFTDSFHLERVIVDAAKNLNLQVRIDHKSKSLNFGTDLNTTQDEVIKDGPHLQSMPSEQVRNQLIFMARALEKAIVVISPKEIQDSRDSLRHQILQAYKQSSKKDHLHMLKRRQIIEDRKEELENLNNQREKEEQEIQEEQRRKQYEAEMARLAREAEEREKRRKIDEHRDIQKKVVKERLEQIKSTTIGQKAFADLSEDVIASMDMDDILAKQVEQLEKEKKEKDEKLKSQEKKIDYFERAKCIEEIPLIIKKYEEDKVVSKKFWEEIENERIKELIYEHTNAILLRDRSLRIKPDQKEFLDKLRSERMTQYKEKMTEFEIQLALERKKRLLERKYIREEDRRLAYYKEKEEQIQRKKDEELKRQREEEERRAEEKREEENRKYQEKLQALAIVEEKKRQKELVIEERERMRKEEAKKALAAENDNSPVRIQKEDTWHRGPQTGREQDTRITSSWRDGDDDRRNIPSSRVGAYKPESRDRPLPVRDDRNFDRNDRKFDRNDRSGPSRDDKWRNDDGPGLRQEEFKWRGGGRDWRDTPPSRDRDFGPPKKDFRDDRGPRDERGNYFRDSDRATERESFHGGKDEWSAKLDRSGYLGDDKSNREDRNFNRDNKEDRSYNRDFREDRNFSRDNKDDRVYPRDNKDRSGFNRDFKDDRGYNKDNKEDYGKEEKWTRGGVTSRRDEDLKKPDDAKDWRAKNSPPPKVEEDDGWHKVKKKI